MTEPIRWGILATGAIANSFVSDLKLLPDAEVVAVGSRSAAAAGSFAARHGIPRAYGSWQELAEDPDVDVVYVATPHSAHYAATKTCLLAGKPTLTEKPFTLDLASATELTDLATARGVFLMEAMWTRCFPTIHRVGELIADGAIGEVTAVQADFGLAGPFPPTSRLFDPALGGGALLDLGVYPITIAHLFLGAPDEITAWANLTERGVDASTGMLFGYRSGALATLSCSLVADTPRRAGITGTRGRIELPRGFFHPTGFWRSIGEKEPEFTAMPYEGLGYHFEAAEVHRCLRAGLTESPLMPLAETLAVMSTLDEVRARIGLDFGRTPGTSTG